MNNEKTQELTKDDLPELYCLIANEIGFENTLKLAKLLGGSYIYFNKIESIERPLRDRHIREEFNGYNYKELAKKYNLTEIQIRNICSEIIEKKKAEPLEGQITLFE